MGGSSGAILEAEMVSLIAAASDRNPNSVGDGIVDAALEAEIGDYWNERAESYSNGVRGELGDSRSDAWRRVLARVAGTHVQEALADGREARVLDLGCGPGFFSILFAEMGCRVDAVDASAEMLSRARSNIKALSRESSVSLHQGDVTTLPFEDGSFDIVASRNLTWLMRNPVAAYAEWMRVLRPGGKLVVFDANWYLYLVNPMIDARRHADQDDSQIEEWGEGDHATTAEERRCEVIAAELPLTPVVRPAWDLDILPELGASDVRADENVWAELWTESESRFYASSPLFMVEAVKGTA